MAAKHVSGRISRAGFSYNGIVFTIPNAGNMHFEWKVGISFVPPPRDAIFILLKTIVCWFERAKIV